ncbi:MAG: hypothetical protein IT378_16005 [Sandaracinaceae bacterium]|nr:hypothetical protein [Sandaracinaceae bacterium]
MTPAAAQSRRVEITLRPTARAQLAIWIQSEDGSRFATLGLTQSIAHHGIGNRPGALQMNSGFDWPYGRREGALPIWAHRRVAAGGEPFRRVIFNGRISEGNASSAGSFAEPANTTEPLFCLSFDVARSGRDALDAVGCPSRFYSNKGRYLVESDLASGYAEPFERPGRVGTMRPLSLDSLYPPRRDEPSCQGPCGDHSDVSRYAADVRRIMPEIDAITMATPAGDAELGVPWDVPADWPEGPYVVFVEVNVEGDYNSVYDAASYPTPVTPPARWDGWAIDYGYAYRGQPVIFICGSVRAPRDGRLVGRRRGRGVRRPARRGRRRTPARPHDHRRSDRCARQRRRSAEARAGRCARPRRGPDVGRVRPARASADVRRGVRTP